MWAQHDRLDAHDPSHDIELIYGARRLFVARHLNKSLQVELRELSDREAIVWMDIENRHRKDISPYERGLSYARWLQKGHLQSQEEIGRALKVSSSQVSRLLKLARLPSAIVAAFGSPIEICEGWGLELIEALEDPSRRQATMQAARATSSQTVNLRRQNHAQPSSCRAEKRFAPCGSGAGR
jgi:ParB family chromosome partitioning protein